MYVARINVTQSLRINLKLIWFYHMRGLQKVCFGKRKLKNDIKVYLQLWFSLFHFDMDYG